MDISTTFLITSEVITWNIYLRTGTEIDLKYSKTLHFMLYVDYWNILGLLKSPKTQVRFNLTPKYKHIHSDVKIKSLFTRCRGRFRVSPRNPNMYLQTENKKLYVEKIIKFERLYPGGLILRMRTVTLEIHTQFVSLRSRHHCAWLSCIALISNNLATN